MVINAGVIGLHRCQNVRNGIRSLHMDITLTLHLSCTSVIANEECLFAKTKNYLCSFEYILQQQNIVLFLQAHLN